MVFLQGNGNALEEVKEDSPLYKTYDLLTSLSEDQNIFAGSLRLLGGRAPSHHASWHQAEGLGSLTG